MTRYSYFRRRLLEYAAEHPEQALVVRSVLKYLWLGDTYANPAGELVFVQDSKHVTVYRRGIPVHVEPRAKCGIRLLGHGTLLTVFRPDIRQLDWICLETGKRETQEDVLDADILHDGRTAAVLSAADRKLTLLVDLHHTRSSLVSWPAPNAATAVCLLSSDRVLIQLAGELNEPHFQVRNHYRYSYFWQPLQLPDAFAARFQRMAGTPSPDVFLWELEDAYVLTRFQFPPGRLVGVPDNQFAVQATADPASLEILQEISKETLENILTGGK